MLSYYAARAKQEDLANNQCVFTVIHTLTAKDGSGWHEKVLIDQISRL